ncbi:MAG: hypothetical protein D6679_07680 [Candidatus Hydrogenedentota bacterium]|nr:MAG: hypothetical protein D6679_07680 [Candidatus Hydrogenedentota bacterium]
MSGIRPSRRAVIALFGVALLAWGCRENLMEPLPAVREVNLTAWQWGYEPARITVRKGTILRLRARSLDVEHTLTNRALGIDLVIPARKEGEEKGPEAGPIEIPATVPGTYAFTCHASCGPARSRQIFKLVVTN